MYVGDDICYVGPTSVHVCMYVCRIEVYTFCVCCLYYEIVNMCTCALCGLRLVRAATVIQVKN